MNTTYALCRALLTDNFSTLKSDAVAVVTPEDLVGALVYRAFKSGHTWPLTVEELRAEAFVHDAFKSIDSSAEALEGSRCVWFLSLGKGESEREPDRKIFENVAAVLLRSPDYMNLCATFQKMAGQRNAMPDVYDFWREITTRWHKFRRESAKDQKPPSVHEADFKTLRLVLGLHAEQGAVHKWFQAARTEGFDRTTIRNNADRPNGEAVEIIPENAGEIKALIARALDRRLKDRGGGQGFTINAHPRDKALALNSLQLAVEQKPEPPHIWRRPGLDAAPAAAGFLAAGLKIA